MQFERPFAELVSVDHEERVFRSSFFVTHGATLIDPVKALRFH
jgi:hypothetical protein